jgi:hypothetical protein
MFNKDLGEKALIVNLTIGVWSARKSDKNVLREITQMYHTDQEHGSFSKLLISKNRLESIKDVASAARKYHNEMTLPWVDGGGRLLPSKDFADYNHVLNNYQSEFFSNVDSFVNSYDTYIQEGIDKLGQIADSKDYPTKDAIKAKYEFKYTYFPVPDDGDFRVTISPDFVNALKTNFQDSHQDRFSRAKQSVVREIVDLVSNAIKRLSNEDESSWFKATTIESIVSYRENHAMIELLDDQDLFDLIDELSTIASLHSISDLRSSLSTRQTIALSLKSSLEKASRNHSLITEPIEILSEDTYTQNNSDILSSAEDIQAAIDSMNEIVPDQEQTPSISSAETKQEDETKTQDINDIQTDILSLSPDDVIMNPFGVELMTLNPSTDEHITQDQTILNYFQDMSQIEKLKDLENNY